MDSTITARSGVLERKNEAIEQEGTVAGSGRLSNSYLSATTAFKETGTPRIYERKIRAGWKSVGNSCALCMCCAEGRWILHTFYSKPRTFIDPCQANMDLLCA